MLPAKAALEFPGLRKEVLAPDMSCPRLTYAQVNYIRFGVYLFTGVAERSYKQINERWV